MVYEHCLTERNATLFNIFGQLDKIPEEIPASGTLLNVTTGNGTLDSLIMPELPECDLEKELDNVSLISSFPYNSPLLQRSQYFSPLSSFHSRHRGLGWRSSYSRKRSINFPALNSGPCYSSSCCSPWESILNSARWKGWSRASST